MKNLFFIAALFVLISVFNTDSKSVESQSGDSTITKTSDVKTDIMICPVSKEEFKTGAGKKVKYLGKEYEFCCGGCVAEFKLEPIGYTGGVATCPICDEDDAKSTISTVHDGTKIYFCNEGCKKTFIKDPEKALEKYNK